MLGKNTVLFITDEKFVSAEPIIEELNKDTKFLGVDVPARRLCTKTRLRLQRPYVFLKSKVWLPVSRFLHKFFPNVKVQEGPILFDVMDKKKVYNMIFRYAPSALMVSDPTIRYSVASGIERSGMKVPVFVYSDQLGFDDALISKDNAHYFVDNIISREKLVATGIPSSKIEVTPIPVAKEYYELIDVAAAKQRIGAPPKKKICAVLAEDEYPVPESNAGLAFMRPGKPKDAESEEGVSEHEGEEGVGLTELLQAADIVATRYNHHTVKRVAAMGKPLVLLLEDEGNDPSAEYLVADGKAMAVRRPEYLSTAVDDVLFGETVLRSPDSDPKSAERICAKIKELITGKQ